MLTKEMLQELHSAWLPNITDQGLDRLIELLEQNSPLLIHGSFTRAVPQGCLVTQIAWNHLATCHLTQEAGISWLNHVAGLNPATSVILRAWDHCGTNNWELRNDLLTVFKEDRLARKQETQPRKMLRSAFTELSGMRSKTV